MHHPFAGLLLAAQGEEGFALQVEDVLLRDPGGFAQFAAGEHVGQFARDVGFVFGDVAAFLEHEDAHAQGGQGVAAGGINLLRQRRMIAALQQMQHLAFGLGQQVIAVEHGAIRRAEDAELPRFFRAGGHFGHGDLLEDALQEGQVVGVLGAHGRVDHAAQHLFGAAAGRDHARAHFHQTGVQFHRGHHPAAVHGDLTAAAERQARRRDHHRLVEVADAHVQVLESLDRRFQLIPQPLLRRHHHGEQVGARAEVVGLVADHQPVELAGIGAVERLVHHGEDVVVQGVHLGVELHAAHAVAQVNQRRAGVLGHHLAGRACFAQEDQARCAVDGFVVALRRMIDGHLARPFVLVEGLVAFGQHLVHPGRGLEAGLFDRRQRLRHAEFVPQLERAGLMGEAPAQGIVNRLGRIGDLRDDLRGIGHALVGQRPHQLPGAVVRGQQDLHPGGQVFLAFRPADGVEARLARRLVLEGFQVQVPELALAVLIHPLVEALFGLVAQPAVGNHLAQHAVGAFRVQVALRFCVVGDGLRQVAAHVIPNVQADQVEQAEGGRLRAADHRAGDGVHLFDRVAVLQDVVHGEGAGHRSDAVADEVRRVLAGHNALPQPVLPEVADELHHLRQGVVGGDDFQQFQVTRRVEEVRAQEVLAEALRAPFGDGVDRDAGRVGAHDGVRRAHGVHPLEQLPLDLQVLHHRLDHPVGLRHGIEIVLQVAQGDQSGVFLGEETGRAGLERPLEALLHDAVAHRPVLQGQPLLLFFRGQRTGHDVQQRDRHAGVRQVRGDGSAHRPCADHHGVANLVFHGFPPLVGGLQDATCILQPASFYRNWLPR